MMEESAIKEKVEKIKSMSYDQLIDFSTNVSISDLEHNQKVLLYRAIEDRQLELDNKADASVEFLEMDQE